jgi:UDP-glucose 4-epimerase
MKGFVWALKILSMFTGLINKAFGNLTYEHSISEYKQEYRKFNLFESIEATEK